MFILNAVNFPKKAYEKKINNEAWEYKSTKAWIGT